MNKLTENFFTVLKSYDIKKPSRKSSLIAPWLGIERTPSGMSQKIGNYLEDWLALDMGDQNKLLQTDYKKGRNFMITYDGSNHQIDMLAKPSNWNKYVHREIKTNTDLDAGKKRDTRSREKVICAWMKSQGFEYDSGIFCPFFYNKGKNVSGLGWVDGLQWYIDTFNPPWTIQNFKDLGRNPETHLRIGLK